MEGSNGKVLRNFLNISSSTELERIETELLFDLTDQLLDELDRDYCFSVADILQMHRRWLGSVYEWAGKYRQVMISKENFTFAVPAYLPSLMEEFEKNILTRYTPCSFSSEQEIVTALAVVHTELILIHPFREGNGRVSRLLAILMALQAGLPLLDFSEFERERQQEYFLAVRYGIERNYKPMERVFTDVISRSLAAYDE